MKGVFKVISTFVRISHVDVTWRNGNYESLRGTRSLWRRRLAGGFAVKPHTAKTPARRWRYKVGPEALIQLGSEGCESLCDKSGLARFNLHFLCVAFCAIPFANATNTPFVSPTVEGASVALHLAHAWAGAPLPPRWRRASNQLHEVVCWPKMPPQMKEVWCDDR